MTLRRGKAYTTALHNAAMTIVSAYVNETANLMPDSDATRVLAHDVVFKTLCTYVTARSHVARAFRILRNPNHHETKQWGGAREGSGWVKGRARKTNQTNKEN